MKRKRSAPERLDPSPRNNSVASVRPRKYVSAKRTIAHAPNTTTNDIAALKKMFAKTCGSRHEVKSVNPILNPKLEKVYEAHAAKLAKTVVPLLDRSKPPESEIKKSHLKNHPVKKTCEEKGLVREKFAFHGTPKLKNIASISKIGFKTPTFGGMYGNAIYSSGAARMAMTYSFGTNAVIGCKGLAFTNETFGNINAIKNKQRVLPVCVIHYQLKSKRRKTKK